MTTEYHTDAERSALRPAGPHLIERSSDSPAQTIRRGQVTIGKSYTATVATAVPAIQVTPKKR